ncbi:dipeptidyl-peptidase III, partial [Aureobasidium melanogenum]
MDPSKKKQYLADSPPSVVPLAIKPHFEALAHTEQLYSHYISSACFAGTRIVLRQVSPESEPIYDFILSLHKQCNGDYSKLKSETGLDDEDMNHWLNYAAQFLGNAGNYKSFGDSKFIPRLAPEKLAALGKVSGAAKHYELCKDAFYETKVEDLMHLGYPPQHLTTYYPESPEITKDEIAAIADFVKENGNLLPENTRLKKLSSGDFELLIASAETDPAKSDRDVSESSFTLDVEPVKGKKISLKYGDHAKEMEKIAAFLTEAKKHSANQYQSDMHSEYIKSFRTGSMTAHVQSQRHWIKDKGPDVESNIGFIETHRDPHGIRGEWEGFAAMVNKERTKAFAHLVAEAPKNIKKLPWPAEFEKNFVAPDFTALEVLCFAGSGIPAGINIPNYDSVRQDPEGGFKNVSLSNVLSAKPPNEKIPFIKDEDMELYKKYADAAFEVQVGLHELLGHGCGKILQETEPGKFNFDHKNPPISPITQKPITSYYKPGETWGSVFGGMGPSYEECRAECVAMALCPDYGILQIFGFGNGEEDLHGEAGNVLYAAYLSMARAGVAALQFYNVEAKKWGQAHMQARHAILKVFLSEPEFCKLEYTKDDLSDLTIKLDRTKIATHGRPAVEKFLQKLQVFKATADLKAGKELYEGITSVDEWFATKVRPAVLAAAPPRKVFVQANTFIEGDKVVLKEYPATPEGLIQSYADRDYI